MNKLLISTALVAASLAPQAFAQVNSATHSGGKAAMCIGCHGIPGYQMAYPHVYRVPLLGGQNAKYIESALKAYQSGERKHPTMRSIAASLSDKDINELAVFYAGEGAAK